MKFETFMLRSLFAACLVVCTLTLVSMIRVPAQTIRLTTDHSLSMLLAAPVSCTLPADGLVCLRAES